MPLVNTRLFYQYSPINKLYTKMNFSQSTPHHLWGAEAYKRKHTKTKQKKKEEKPNKE